MAAGGETAEAIMGYILHHAIVVTSWNQTLIAEAHEVAKANGFNPSEITPCAVNGYRSFFVPPDGSKEGWEESNERDSGRAGLTGWLDRQRHEDGSTSLKWVEVAIGCDDPDDTEIVNRWRNIGEAAGEAGEVRG